MDPDSMKAGDVIYTAVKRFGVIVLVSARIRTKKPCDSEAHIDFIYHPDPPNQRGPQDKPISTYFWHLDPVDAVKMAQAT